MYYDLYRFRGRAGQRVVITLHSPEFELTLSEAGTYVIRAQSHFAEQTGAYTLLVGRSQ